MKIFLLLLSLVFSALQANAATCSFTPTSIAFGLVDTLSSTTSQTAGKVNVRCNSLLAYSVSMTISIGAGSGGASASARRLAAAGSSSPLLYQIYTDSARTQVFGSSYWAYGGNTVTLSGGNLFGSTGADIMLYARVFAAQSGVPPGTYTSSFGPADVVVTLRVCDLLIICRNETASFSFNISATVPANCLVAASDLDFGATGTLTAVLDSSSEIDVRCTANTAYSISLDNGLDGTGPDMRHMRSGAGNRVRYGLYRDAARTQPWGAETSGTAQSGSGTGSSARFTVHGRVPAQTTPPAGVYSDTVVVTITY